MESLHPSWVAKRKQSGTLASIGTAIIPAKKIKFDENGGIQRENSIIGAARVVPASGRGGVASSGKPESRGKVALDAKPLHPSWEAHKKSKAAAAAAASIPAAPTGKKTVFKD